MNAPSPQPPVEAAARAESACRETAAPIRKPQSAEAAHGTEVAEGNSGSRERARSGGREKVQPIRDLLEACLRMLKLTGGSQYWTGDTQAALEFMEAAVAGALETGALRTPQPAASAVVPEIVASVASSVDCALQMAGIEAESGRAV
jgi:hypothetical protein